MSLRLKDQLCFPLYAVSRQITSVYRPLLEKINLTYPQYLVMMLLWEHTQLSVKQIGQHLLLDSGTLTPLLKRMEQSGLLVRTRDSEDERLVQIEITKTGEKLRATAQEIPTALGKNLPITQKEMASLAKQLQTILKSFNQLTDK